MLCYPCMAAIGKYGFDKAGDVPYRLRVDQVLLCSGPHVVPHTNRLLEP